MTPANSDCVLWLGLIEVGDGGGGGEKFHFQTCSIIFPYPGILRKEKNFPQKSGSLTITGGVG